MSPYEHCQSSAKKFGGNPKDYWKIHAAIDATKACCADARHRIFFHHTGIIPVIESLMGPAIRNFDSKYVPVREIIIQHLREDFDGFVPTPADWLSKAKFDTTFNPKKIRETISSDD